MFEHFGLKDVLSGLLKFKLLFFMIMIICVLLGGAVQYKQVQAIKTNNQDSSSWTSTAFFAVDDKTYKQTDSTKANEKEAELRRFAATYHSLVKSDLSNAYVYDQLLKNDSKKDFITKAKLGISENQFSPADIGKLVTCSVIENTATLNLTVTSKNKEISEQLLQYYSEYLTNTIQKSIKENTLTSLGTTTQSTVSKGGKSSKSMIMAIMGGIVFYLLFVFTWTLFFPTINRKSDFEQYGVKVIAEL